MNKGDATRKPRVKPRKKSPETGLEKQGERIDKLFASPASSTHSAKRKLNKAAPAKPFKKRIKLSDDALKDKKFKTQSNKNASHAGNQPFSRHMLKKDEDDAAEGRVAKKAFPSHIKNKLIRSLQYSKLRVEKKKLKKSRQKERDAAEKQALELGEVPPPRKAPRTIENTREEDETVAQPGDEELHAEDAADEFSAHFNHEIIPQLLITSSRWCSTITIKLIAELLKVLPNAHYYKRGSYEIKQIVKYAKNRDFTAIIIVHDNRKEPNGMLIISLPEGPTAHFKLSNLVLSKKIKGHGKPTSHLPELILNNFSTRIGHRVGRMLASLFPQQPNFRGRRVVTFHNQRDFIFFRHHRYVFEAKESSTKVKKAVSKEDGKKAEKPRKDPVIARLQECGPRFTLKLLSLQHGTFDSKYGEYEWVHKADMDTSRRRFFM